MACPRSSNWSLRKSLNLRQASYSPSKSSTFATTQPLQSTSEPFKTFIELTFSFFTTSVSPDSQNLSHALTSPSLYLARQRMIPIHPLTFRRYEVCLLFIKGIGLYLSRDVLLSVLPRQASERLKKKGAWTSLPPANTLMPLSSSCPMGSL